LEMPDPPGALDSRFVTIASSGAELRLSHDAI